ncbi:hypothetical protein FB451DRAFT_1398298 [Mycena latifolia]|nr:hypothetical protein FB451DRAFT_1398298 [Mycena latifolia]
MEVVVGSESGHTATDFKPTLQCQQPAYVFALVRPSSSSLLPLSPPSSLPSLDYAGARVEKEVGARFARHTGVGLQVGGAREERVRGQRPDRTLHTPRAARAGTPRESSGWCACAAHGVDPAPPSAFLGRSITATRRRRGRGTGRARSRRRGARSLWCAEGQGGAVHALRNAPWPPLSRGHAPEALPRGAIYAVRGSKTCRVGGMHPLAFGASCARSCRLALRLGARRPSPTIARALAESQGHALQLLGFFVAFLSRKLIANSNIVALVATLSVRFVAGPLVDRYGPRKVMAGLLVLGAIPSGLAGTAHSAQSIYVLKFFIGILGGTFVPCQASTACFVDKNIAGREGLLSRLWFQRILVYDPTDSPGTLRGGQRLPLFLCNITNVDAVVVAVVVGEQSNMIFGG